MKIAFRGCWKWFFAYFCGLSCWNLFHTSHGIDTGCQFRGWHETAKRSTTAFLHHRQSGAPLAGISQKRAGAATGPEGEGPMGGAHQAWITSAVLEVPYRTDKVIIGFPGLKDQYRIVGIGSEFQRMHCISCIRSRSAGESLFFS